MGKVLWIEDEDGFDQNRPSDHPGCMSGIFHALDYHYWQSNVKKILPHRKHEDFIKRNRRYQRISDDQDPFEVIKLLDTKTSHIQMDPRNTKTNSSQKRSFKARIKAFVSEHDNKQQDQDSVPTPKLHRTYSIHHLETNEWVHPIIFFPENAPEKAESNVNESRDILDMFEVDKEIFINTLQYRSQDLVARPKLTKSGSFPMKLKDKLNETYNVSKSEKMKNSNDDIILLRRVFSLNESADRYTRLCDLSKEATLRASRSLKLTNGSESVLSSFSRSNSNQESRAGLFVRSFSENERNLDSFNKGSESLNEVMDKSDDLLENEANSRAFGKDSHEGDNNQISPDERYQISEGFNSLSNTHENPKKEIKTINSKKHMDLSTKDDDFTYVQKILERSGFLKNGFQQTWHSSNQPLDPFVFQELESQYLHDPERFAEEINELCHRLLIFDLVDEALVTMYETSFAYYPKKLSSFCHVRRASTASLVLDEVWTCVSRLNKLKHDVNDSLNDIVSRDLGSDDGWMNLGSDLECVGLGLEDLVLDEILEELVCEFF